MTRRERVPEGGLRERAGVALLRLATDLALAAWVESVLMWLGWRLLPADAAGRRMSSR